MATQKKNSKDLEEEFYEQTKEGLPSRTRKTLEQVFEDKLWDKEDDPEPDRSEWI